MSINRPVVARMNDGYDIRVDPAWFKAWMKAIEHMGKDAVLIGLYELGINIYNINEMQKKPISAEVFKWAEKQLKLLKKRNKINEQKNDVPE